MLRLAFLTLVLASLPVLACGDSGASSTADAGDTPSGDGGGNLADASNTDAATVAGANNEFDGTATLPGQLPQGWRLLGEPATQSRPNTRLALGDIGITKPGWLVLVPEEGPQFGWFQDNWGPYLYREITGNFAVATHLRVVCKSQTPSADCRPAPGFNAGGFVFRDPIGSADNDENWVMYNMGGQGPGGYAREIKKTVNSNSALFLNVQATVEEYFLGCRIGSEFHFFYWDEGASDWQHERFDSAATQVGGSGFSTIISAFSDPGGANSVDMFFNHTEMPQTIQVGLISHNWAPNVPQNTRSEYDFVRFAEQAPTSVAECSAAFQDLGL